MLSFLDQLNSLFEIRDVFISFFSSMSYSTRRFNPLHFMFMITSNAP